MSDTADDLETRIWTAMHDAACPCLDERNHCEGCDLRTAAIMGEIDAEVARPREAIEQIASECAEAAEVAGNITLSAIAVRLRALSKGGDR